MHLDSLLLLPDTLLRSLHLQGTPKENQRLKRAWGARLRFNSDQRLTHLLLLLRQGGDRDKAIGWFTALLSGSCLGVILETLGWLKAPIREALLDQWRVKKLLSSQLIKNGDYWLWLRWVLKRHWVILCSKVNDFIGHITASEIILKCFFPLLQQWVRWCLVRSGFLRNSELTLKYIIYYYC